MLISLQVHNLAIVENAAFSPGAGFNVITGETGAGKSILIGALHLLLGQRADKTIIRTGTTEASVNAVFELPADSPVHALLAETGLPPCEDGQLLIRRIVTPTASRCQVNDAPATLQTLKRITALLVDLHGPNDQQSLLDPRFQLELLDAFGRHTKERAACAEAWRAVRDLEAERETLCASSQNVAQETDRLRFIIDDITSANVTREEDETLVDQHAEAANAQQILATSEALLQLLTEDDASAFNQLIAAQSQLTELARLLPDAADWNADIRQAALTLQETAATLSNRIRRIDDDPQRLDFLEGRMAALQRLKRKYGPGFDDIQKTLDDAQTRLAALENLDAELARLDAQTVAARTELERHAKTLHTKRTKTATRLAAAITDELRDLGFLKAEFGVALLPIVPRQDGADNVVFQFAPNPGEAARPLEAIASSGETARVMLAVKAILAQHDHIPTLVFDEIDANIGGEVGHKVGEKLAFVAHNHQVLCITHLPQVAACGDAHFVVAKHVANARTSTRIEPVDGEPRALEIARMLGGAERSPVVLDHARALLRRDANT